MGDGDKEIDIQYSLTIWEVSEQTAKAIIRIYRVELPLIYNSD